MIRNIETGETVYDHDGCRGIRIYEAHGNEYVHLSIRADSEIPEHSLPLAVSFYVLRGNGICTVSGMPFTTAQGDMLECPPDAPRRWRNDSAEPLEVLVIKREACS